MSTAPITLVVAPGIPATERLALETHVRETVSDPNYTIVLNYEAMFFEVVIPEDSRVMLIAPGIPLAEIQALRSRFDAVREGKTPRDRVLVVNYDMRIDVLTPGERNKTSYGEVYPIDIEGDPLG